MSIDFKLKDFAYPISILKFRSFLEKSQWFSEGLLKQYQLKRLRLVLEHAYKNVPYYRGLFNKISLKPTDIKSTEDLTKIPLLTKEILKKNFKMFVAKNAKRFNPALYKTSGTTGESVEFYLDKYSNILEFCYYWRYWSWAGYKLGMPFAEFTLHRFLNTDIKGISSYSLITRRLSLNPAELSYGNIDKFTEAIKKYRPLFLKGSPSSIYMFGLLLEKRRNNNISFKAVFTTGERVLPYQREAIERVFNCRILDSFGHMERTVAISQCPLGSYHINSEYGILEIEEDPALSSDTKIVGRIIGTSLHNFAMPLIRYAVDDIVEMQRQHRGCKCGRKLSVAENIYGRTQDVIVTKDGRLITNSFIIFNFTKGILWYQIIQHDVDNIIVKVLANSAFTIQEKDKLLSSLQNLIGPVNIQIESIGLKDTAPKMGEKYRPVISRINI